MNSLKEDLIREIYRQKYVPIERIYEIAKEHGRKQSNAERRLRSSEAPGIEGVYNEKGTAIIAYQVKRVEVQPIPEPIVQPTQLI